MKLRGFLAVAALLIAGGGVWMKWGTRPETPAAREIVPQAGLIARKDRIEKPTIAGNSARLAVPFEEELVRTWSLDKSENKILELVRGIGLSDPTSTLEILLKQPEGHLRTKALLALAEGWARKDPQGAAAAILQNCKSRDLDRLLGQVVGIWIIASPDACLTWLDSQLPDPALKELQFQQAYAVWARDSPVEALAGLVGHARTPANLRVVFATFADLDFPAAVESYKLLSTPEQNSLQESLILIGAAEGAPEVERLLVDFLDTHRSEKERIQLGRNLVSIDQVLALKVVESGSSDEEKRRIKDRVFSGVVAEVPDDSDAELIEMVGKPALSGAGHKPSIEAAIPSIGLPKKQPLANDAIR